MRWRRLAAGVLSLAFGLCFPLMIAATAIRVGWVTEFEMLMGLIDFFNTSIN